ncbi:MAG TPA: AarF/UbiB family protein [Candidatus Nitrosotalea sp.]|nr:AarF/UbiB family protein [Candidatus Nitrosotalea sp.]
MRPEHLRRYRDVAWLLARHGGLDLVRSAGLESGLRGLEPAPQRTADPSSLAADLESLGPTYIKLGQLLSTRSDLLSETELEALSRLQDDVAPFPFAEVEAMIESELGARISKIFSNFEAEPVAAASLGQVHRATLRDGREVAVKVQRPGVREVVDQDLQAFAEIAAWLQSHTEVGRRLGLSELLEEFAKSLSRELDYRQEARNLATLRGNLADFKHLVVPEPVEDLTTSRILTMSFVRGIKVTELSNLARLELPGQALAGELFRAYLKQILVDGFFHADPHPGNVLVTPDGRLALIDLGMVAYVAPRLQEHLIQLLLAVAEARSDDAVAHSLRIAQPPADFDETAYARAVADLVNRHRDATASTIEIGRTMLELFRISGTFEIHPAPELSLLGKALLNLDQIGWMLDPDFDVNGAIRASASDLMRSRMAKAASPGAVIQSMLELKDLTERLPSRLNRMLDLLSSNQFEVRIRAFDEGQLLSGLHKIANRITLGLLMAAMIVSAGMMMRVPSSVHLLGYPAVAIVFFGVAAAGSLFLILSILRDDRRH